MPELTAAVAVSVAVLALLPVLVVARFALVTLADALYSHFFTQLGTIPEPPLPFLRRVTVGHGLMRHFLTSNSVDAAAQFNEWRAVHGSMFIVRSLFGAPQVFCMSVEAVRRVTLQKPLLYRKTEQMRVMTAGFVGRKGIFLAEGSEHTAIRRAVSPALHHEALKVVEGVFREEGRRFCTRLSEAGKELDVYTEAGAATFRVIALACFGEGSMSEEQLSDMREAYLASLIEAPERLMRRVMLQTFFGFLNPDWFDNNKQEKRYFQNMIYKLCETAQNASKSPESYKRASVESKTASVKAVPRSRLLSLMIDEDTKFSVTHTQMVETVMSFMAAGQATTAMSVSWTLYLLCKHPDWQRRLRAELDSKWTEHNSQEELDGLPVMHRIIKESLRLYPPGHTLGRTLSKPDVLDGVELPKGTTIRLPILAMHRDEVAWGADASEFRPDRFLPEQEAKRPTLLWCPFLFGPRGCIGQRFAMLEMKTFIAHVISQLEVFVDESRDPPPQVFGSLGHPRNMRLYVRPRTVPPI